MVTRLVRFALARPLVIVTAALVLAVAGVWAFSQLKIEAYPDLTDPTVVVVTVYPGFAAEEVEQQVTVPIERALNNTPYVIGRRSRTIFGLSVVQMIQYWLRLIPAWNTTWDQYRHLFLRFP
jgi:cobalt-zinc-cadmium resistance protein CzcA